MSEFVDYLHELFVNFGPISSRRMFGGHGLYRDDLMFGIVVRDTLYLRTDDSTRARFEDIGATPFIHFRQGKPVTMPFHEAPDTMMDDRISAAVWATLAWEAASRAGKTASGEGQP